MIDPALKTRDINFQFYEFLEQITIKYKVPLVIDPFTLAPVKEEIKNITLNVSWHDITTQSLQTDRRGEAVLGILSSGDAYCIYQGNLNLWSFHLPQNIIIRNGIKYVIETVTNPNENRWILALKRVR